MTKWIKLPSGIDVSIEDFDRSTLTFAEGEIKRRICFWKDKCWYKRLDLWSHLDDDTVELLTKRAIDNEMELEKEMVGLTIYRYGSWN